MQMTTTSGVLALVSLCAPALGQLGTIDQVSPRIYAAFNLDGPAWVWQQQVRAGMSGQLEGMSIDIIGPIGAEFTLRIRLGNAPSSSPVVFTTLVEKATSDQIETQFIDMRASNILLASGGTFVLETRGNGTGAFIAGNHTNPLQGPPLYPEPLYFNETPFVAGWKHGFTSYMLGSACQTDFNGDGLVNVQDFLGFLGAYATGDARADFNSNGVVNVQDFLAFLSAYSTGCP